MSLPTKLSGTHVLITGGSKGIGKSIAQGFLRQGANVSYCSRGATGREYNNFTEAAYEAKAIGSQVDIGNPEGIEKWVKESAEKFGRVDVVVANACPFINETDVSSWRSSFEADVVGLLSLINASTPYLEKSAKEGRNPAIIVISSLAGFEARHHAVTGPYTPLKRAQAVIAKDFSRKLAPLGIRINTVVPGAIGTPGETLEDGTYQESKFWATMQAHPEYLEKLNSEIAMARPGKVEEVSNLVVFLGSSLASYITGAEVIIDGGMSVCI